MRNGDSVIVENKDGETADGEVVAVLETTVGEFTQAWMDDGETLLDYWDGHDVSADETVVTVSLDESGGNYSYPQSRVEVAEE
jgi:hypothetical protein